MVAKTSVERYYSIKIKRNDPISKKLEKIVNKYNVSINAAFKIYLTDLELKNNHSSNLIENENISIVSKNNNTIVNPEKLVKIQDLQANNENYTTHSSSEETKIESPSVSPSIPVIKNDIIDSANKPTSDVTIDNSATDTNSKRSQFRRMMI